MFMHKYEYLKRRRSAYFSYGQSFRSLKIGYEIYFNRALNALILSA